MENTDVFQDLSKFSYQIIDQRSFLKKSEVELQVKFYTFWQEYWDQVLTTVGIDDRIDPLEFFQQTKVTALLYKNEIVSMHLLSLYDRADFNTHPYFKKFDQGFIEGIQRLPIEKILTLQYLAQNPKFKREKPYIYFPMVIGSLSVLHQSYENAQATVSVARKDLGISNALSKMNFSNFQEDGVFNNTPVSYQISTQPKIYPSELVEKMTAYFWKNRIEFKEQINNNMEVA